MDIHIALGHELARLCPLQEGDQSGEVTKTVCAVEESILRLPARSLLGAVLQLRVMASYLGAHQIDDDLQDMLLDAALSALAAVEAAGGIDPAAYGGDAYYARGPVH